MLHKTSITSVCLLLDTYLFSKNYCFPPDFSPQAYSAGYRRSSNVERGRRLAQRGGGDTSAMRVVCGVQLNAMVFGDSISDKQVNKVMQ